MPRILLNVPHRLQQSDGDCLAACAVMVLSYLGHSVDYTQLLRLLNIQRYGAPAGNVRLLMRWDFNVRYSKTDMQGLETLLQNGNPVIVFVLTGELPYWSYNAAHTLVVVGYDEDYIYANDPYYTESPMTITRGDFELAWQERDYFYAIISPATA